MGGVAPVGRGRAWEGRRHAHDLAGHDQLRPGGRAGGRRGRPGPGTGRAHAPRVAHLRRAGAPAALGPGRGPGAGPRGDGLRRPPPDPHTIAVESVVRLAELPPELFDRAYWLAPGRNGHRPYRLLHAALEEAEQVAVCRVVLRERERLAVVRAAGDLLVLHTLFWPEDIRGADRVRIAADAAGASPAAEEVTLARRLLEHLERTWDPAEHRDAARARLRAHLAAQVPEAAPAPPAPAPAPVADLMAALRASLARARGQGGDDRGDVAAGA
ncbi:MAG TPA: Ku protein [Miltoncostaeaceae bacterium]|nr:Ku protein [Miltoncostaeaceae bacterium]